MEYLLLIVRIKLYSCVYVHNAHTMYMLVHVHCMYINVHVHCYVHSLLLDTHLYNIMHMCIHIYVHSYVVNCVRIISLLSVSALHNL